MSRSVTVGTDTTNPAVSTSASGFSHLNDWWTTTSWRTGLDLVCIQSSTPSSVSKISFGYPAPLVHIHMSNTSSVLGGQRSNPTRQPASSVHVQLSTTSITEDTTALTTGQLIDHHRSRRGVRDLNVGDAEANF